MLYLPFGEKSFCERQLHTMYNLTGTQIDRDGGLFKVAIYARLSREDVDSDSVENQIKLLMPIVLGNPNWTLVDIYSDDGVTGTTFDRPDFNRLMSDVNAKKVNLIIIKDLSRLGRNLFESEKFFDYCLVNRIRIITVNDRIDSFNHDSQTSFVRPLTCLLNEKYAADVSYNVKSIFAGKRQRGEFIGAFAPYGYQKDPADKNRLVIDNATCGVVHRIYEMYLQGQSLKGIATAFNQEHVLSPAGYKVSTTLYKGGRTKSFLWNPETIKLILTNPTYTGCLTQGKTEKLSFKLKKSRSISKENWITVQNTHEPIISKKDFEAVQILMSKKSYQSSRTSSRHLLSGLIFCGDCGSKLTFVRTGKNFYTMCSRYKRYSSCTRHSFSEVLLTDIIRQELQAIASKALDTGILYDIARNFIHARHKSNQQELFVFAKKEITAVEKKLTENRSLLLTAYQDKINKKISSEDYLDISSSLADENQKLKSRLNLLQKQADANFFSPVSSQPQEILVSDFTDFSAIDMVTLFRLIKKVEIFEDRTVKIHYHFKNPL